MSGAGFYWFPAVGQYWEGLDLVVGQVQLIQQEQIRKAEGRQRNQPVLIQKQTGGVVGQAGRYLQGQTQLRK